MFGFPLEDGAQIAKTVLFLPALPLPAHRHRAPWTAVDHVGRVRAVVVARQAIDAFLSRLVLVMAVRIFVATVSTDAARWF